MKNNHSVFLVVFLVLAFFPTGEISGEKISASRGFHMETGIAVRVSDGDTLDFSNASGVKRIRLLGIDAPEKGQPYGKESRALLIRMVMNRRLTMSWSNIDRYNRTLGLLELDDGTAVSAAMVAGGGAWAFYRYSREVPSAVFARIAAAETNARMHRTGLWSFSNPIPPWDWRKLTR